jgi:hypothetical protein
VNKNDLRYSDPTQKTGKNKSTLAGVVPVREKAAVNGAMKRRLRTAAKRNRIETLTAKGKWP